MVLQLWREGMQRARKGTVIASFLSAGIVAGALVVDPGTGTAGTVNDTTPAPKSVFPRHRPVGDSRNNFPAGIAPADRKDLSSEDIISAPSHDDVTAAIREEGNGRAQLTEHLMSDLSPELFENFDLFIYVSKAERGPWAQHMYVFVKERGSPSDAKLILLENWPVSTGREAIERARNGERVSTDTPAGYYELDPSRFFVQYRSAQWQLDMPNAMFFDWSNRGYQTGLAIHGVSDVDSVAALGQRASAGCVQLPLEASEKLFDLVRDNFEGEVPRFAYDEKTRVTSNKGDLARDEDGNLVMMDGYRALVVIDNYGGGTVTSEVSMDPRHSPG